MSFPTTGQTSYGATVRGYIDASSEAYSVVSAGATGNGTTDDTTAIQTARDAGYGAIFFPPGTYKTTGLGATVANQKWILAPGATITATGANHAISISASGVTIEGPGKIDTGSGSAYSGVFIGAGLTDVDVLGVEITNGTYGVRVKGGTGTVTSRVRVDGCTIHGTSSHGVFFNWECTDSQISSNQIYSPGGNGIWVGNNSDRVVITGNHISSSGRIGIELNAGVPRSVVSGNVINTCTTIGISFDTSDESKMVGNTVISPGSYGLELAGSNACVVQGNTVRSAGSVGISISAPSGTCNDNLIEGNYLYQPTGNGIYAGGSANGAQRLRVISNEVVDAGAGAGSVSGIGAATGIGCTDSFVANNLIRWTLTASSVSGINMNQPNCTIENNVIIHDSGLAAAGGTGISLPSTALDNVVSGNTIIGNGKVNSGITINSSCTGVLVACNKVLGTAQNTIQNSSSSTTNTIVGNVATASAGSGFTFGGAVCIGNHQTNQSYGTLQGALRIAGSSDTLGFYGSAGTTKPTVTGAKGSNAALGSLMTALSGLGLLTDSTSA